MKNILFITFLIISNQVSAVVEFNLDSEVNRLRDTYDTSIEEGILESEYAQVLLYQCAYNEQDLTINQKLEEVKKPDNCRAEIFYAIDASTLGEPVNISYIISHARTVANDDNGIETLKIKKDYKTSPGYLFGL